MSWFKVDDTFHAHPKVVALEDGAHFAEAMALWILAGTWSSANLTDGHVPRAALRRLVPFKATEAAEELVRVGLWEADGDGYRFHDWADYQPTRDQVESKRAEDAERKRKGRSTRRASPVHPDVQTESARTPSGRPSGVQAESVRNPAVPTRPDPTRPVLPAGEEEHPSAPAEPPAAPSLGSEIRELEARYVHGLPAEAREAIALSRRNGKVADSVWLNTLRKLAAHPVDVAEFALRTFCEKHADGEKTEAYLVGIARQEARRRTAGGSLGTAPNRAGYAPPAPPEAFLSTTEAELDEIFGPETRDASPPPDPSMQIVERYRREWAERNGSVAPRTDPSDPKITDLVALVREQAQLDGSSADEVLERFFPRFWASDRAAELGHAPGAMRALFSELMAREWSPGPSRADRKGAAPARPHQDFVATSDEEFRRMCETPTGVGGV